MVSPPRLVILLELGGSQGFYPINEALLPALGFPFGFPREPKAPELKE